ncbi:hypothetical protein PRIPAC_76398 [Pristionchus pacificus]|uniref:Uncharacterized protein n=1 Tax=Pristionchus pacificus TaxID=54126 RepID=A0A2A6C5W6_PRIPA|nr:hypothetical protein PRIPAC_75776 [Pristionchus pacificus]KAF8387256.1 hypothetical protein PRIPAC_76398 [Pristionchus pacificus]|eukprot:PDM73506.1 hypothetical protein PRIPAC_40862 [Pristionchus pacificus]
MGKCFLLSSCFNCTRRTCSDATLIDQREDTASLDAMGSERLRLPPRSLPLPILLPIPSIRDSLTKRPSPHLPTHSFCSSLLALSVSLDYFLLAKPSNSFIRVRTPSVGRNAL